MAMPRLITKVGDKQLLKGEKIYVRDPMRFVRNEDPPGKGNIQGEVNEMMMRPEKFEKKKELIDPEPAPIQLTTITKGLTKFTKHLTLGSFIHNENTMVLGAILLDNTSQPTEQVIPSVLSDKFKTAMNFKIQPSIFEPNKSPNPFSDSLF